MRATTEKTRRLRVVLYCRISQDRKQEEAGIDRQEEDGRALAADMGWDVVEVFRENDVSAYSKKPRPLYERMLRGVQTGAYDAIISWHPDRLYRRLADLERLINVVEEHRVEIRTVNAGRVDLDTATGRMNARIVGVVAQHEGELKAERLKRSIIQKRAAGRPPGGKRMFGYSPDGWTLVPHEAGAVHEGVEYLRGGGTLAGLCRMLNDRGLITTQGNPWEPTQLAHYLRNPRIAGYSTHNGQVVGQGKWPAIINDDTHKLLLRLVRANPRGERTPRVAVLAGMLVCGVCGHKLTTSGRTVKRKGQPNRWVRRYRCPTVKNNPAASGCGKVSGDAEPIEAIVAGYARELIERPEVRERLSELMAAKDSGPLITEAEGLRAHKAALEDSLKNAGAAVGAVVTAIGETAEKLDRVEQELAHLGHDGIPLPAAGEAWPEDLHHRRALIDRVLAKVHLDPDPRKGPGPKGGFVASRLERFDPAEGLEDVVTVWPTVWPSAS